MNSSRAAATASSGNAGEVSLSASAVNFGADHIGDPTAASGLLVSNTGNASLTLGTISLSGGSAGDFSDSGSCAAGLLLEPGASCYLDVTFDPTAVGSRTASLLIGISGGSTVTVNLTGTGNAQEVASSDGPLPLWAYAVLASLLTVIAVRRQRDAD